MKVKLKSLLFIFVSSLVLISISVLADQYAYTMAYFNVPSDVSFRVSLPGDPAGPYNSSLTSPPTTAWISFNATVLPASDVQPWTLGVENVANKQNGPSQPIFYVENAGNTQIDFYINITSELDPCLYVCANSTCGDGPAACPGASFLSPCTDIEGVEQRMADELNYVSGQNHVNITLYSTFFVACIPGEYGPYQITHHSTAD